MAKYDYFAEFIGSFISKEDMRQLNRTFSSDQFQDNPQKMISEIDNFLVDKWNQNSAAGFSAKQTATRKENFETFLRKNVLTREKLKYTNPYTKERNAIDFEPLFSEHKQVTREFVEPKVTGKRVQDSLDLLAVPSSISREDAVSNLKDVVRKKTRAGDQIFDKKGNILQTEDVEKLSTRDVKEIYQTYRPQRKVSQTQFIKRLEKQIDYSDKTNNVDNLVKLRDSLRQLSERSEARPPISTFKAKKLYDEIESKLESRYIKDSKISSKSDERLKEVLTFAGVDVAELDTTKKIRAAAKKNNIGLRNYQKGKQEIILDVLKIRKDVTKEELEGRPMAFLRNLDKQINPALVRPTKEYYVRKADLPTKDSEIEQIYKEQNLDFDVKEKKSVVKDIKKRFPFLSKGQIEREANKELVSRVLDKPVIGEEIERRYMEKTYGNRDKEPAFKDLITISKLRNKDFKEIIAKRELEAKDPSTGKLKVKKSTIPIRSWRSYRDTTKEKVQKAQQIVDLRREEQVERFLTKEVPELNQVEGLDDFDVTELARSEKDQPGISRKETGELPKLKETKEGGFEIV